MYVTEDEYRHENSVQENIWMETKGKTVRQREKT
jgi:hypothetical protein